MNLPISGNHAINFLPFLLFVVHTYTLLFVFASDADCGMWWCEKLGHQHCAEGHAHQMSAHALALQLNVNEAKAHAHAELGHAHQTHPFRPSSVYTWVAVYMHAYTNTHTFTYT